jgi:PleD family two-component response regulator
MPSAPTQRVTVLVADDDPVMRMLMLEMLAQVGLDGIQAGDGIEALDQARTGQPDLILMDVDMPRMDGFAACRAIRAAERDGVCVPVIMVTGSDDIEAVTHAYEVGATDFVSKPINWQILGHRVLYVLRASDAIARLRIADAQNRAVLAAIPDTFFRLNADGFYLDYEQGHERPGPGSPIRPDLPDSAGARFIGKHLTSTLPPDIAGRMLEQMKAVLTTHQVRSVEYELVEAGVAQHFEARLVATSSSEVLGLVRDISERKRTEEQIRRLAYCDGLTGIPNRQAFLETLERELHRSRIDNKKFAVLFMDLDAFKRINDTLGHNAGDQLLKMVSERLRDTTRPSDLVSRGDGGDVNEDGASNLARLGGDEFTILIPDLERVEHALNVAHRVKATRSSSRPASASRCSRKTATIASRFSSLPTPRCTTPRAAARTTPSCTAHR